MIRVRETSFGRGSNYYYLDNIVPNPAFQHDPEPKHYKSLEAPLEDSALPYDGDDWGAAPSEPEAIPHQGVSMSDQRTEVLATNEAFYRAFEKKDIEAMSAVWSQGTGSRCIHPGRDAIRGWKDIRSSWELIFKNTKYIEIETDIITTEIRDNIAYVILVEKLLQISSGRSVQAQSMATKIFEHMGSSWYLIHHHGSPIMR